MTAEFESDAAKTMKANVRPGDLVMVRHGNRFPIYRQAWVTETTEKKLLAEYTDIKRQKDWIPFGSRRLLCDALAGDTALEQEPAAFTKDWNATNPRRQICVNDCIVQMNGLRGND